MPDRASLQRHKRTPARAGVWVLVVSTAILATCVLLESGVLRAAPARQEPPPEAGDPSVGEDRQAAPPENAPPEGELSSQEPESPQVAPELESRYLVRVYKVRPARVFKELLASLAAEGYPPEEVDEEKRSVKTSFVDFKQDNYELQVADPPPRLGPSYRILQMLKVRAGKVSLQAVVAPGKGGTELRVRARILVMGLDRASRVRQLVDRRSTGVIESEFIHKLEARAGLEHL